MSIQTLEQFQTSFGSTPVEIKLGQFGKDAVFYLKPLSSVDRDNFEASIIGPDGNKRNLINLRARLVACAWCDKDGKLIGSPKQIGELRTDLIGALFNEIRTMNGMDKDDVEEAKKE